MKATQNKYDEKQVYASLAGSGNPWGALTRIRARILFALHDKLSIFDIATLFGKTTEDIEAEITPLIEANLLKKQNGIYSPTFIISDATETRRVTDHAQIIGKKLAEQLLSRWEEIETVYSSLDVSQNYTFKEIGLMLVGSRLLDINLLEGLVQDGMILSAPNRPSPDRPDARYYFWMVEGKPEDLGKYGQEDIDLPWSNWSFLTFGRNIINDNPNAARNDLEEKCRELIKSKKVETLKELAKQLNVPIINQLETEHWSEIVKSFIKDLVAVYRENEEELRNFYSSLNASAYAPYGLSELLCWHVHVAYASAIDYLVKKNVVHMPLNQFSAVIWYQKHKREGLLI
ncbi:MAG: hypothetical protein ACFFBD_05115 [Candidatus Hodarchaeota archaeon]